MEEKKTQYELFIEYARENNDVNLDNLEWSRGVCKYVELAIDDLEGYETDLTDMDDRIQETVYNNAVIYYSDYIDRIPIHEVIDRGYKDAEEEMLEDAYCKLLGIYERFMRYEYEEENEEDDEEENEEELEIEN